jgi:hypothetical protein
MANGPFSPEVNAAIIAAAVAVSVPTVGIRAGEDQ